MTIVSQAIVFLLCASIHTAGNLAADNAEVFCHWSSCLQKTDLSFQIPREGTEGQLGSGTPSGPICVDQGPWARGVDMAAWCRHGRWEPTSVGQVWAAVGEGHVVSWEDSPADVLVIYTLFQRPSSFCHLMFRAVCLRWSEPTSLRPDSHAPFPGAPSSPPRSRRSFIRPHAVFICSLACSSM